MQSTMIMSALANEQLANANKALNDGEMVETSVSTLENIVGSMPTPQYYTAPRVVQLKRENKKVGRNDPCPCGSGLKYKKCCLDSGKYEGYTEV